MTCLAGADMDQASAARNLPVPPFRVRKRPASSRAAVFCGAAAFTVFLVSMLSLVDAIK